MDSPFAEGIECAKLEESTTSNQHKGGWLSHSYTKLSHMMSPKCAGPCKENEAELPRSA
jgi:hypothetical protein